MAQKASGKHYRQGSSLSDTIGLLSVDASARRPKAWMKSVPTTYKELIS
ncbi:MAG: hypothetical protein ACR2P9_05655 [Gammaproteobacteria bacterium]